MSGTCHCSVIEKALKSFITARALDDKGPDACFVDLFRRFSPREMPPTAGMGMNTAVFFVRTARRLDVITRGMRYIEGRLYQVHAEPHATPSRVPGANDEYQRMVGALAEHMGMGDARTFKMRAHFAELVRAHPIVLFLDLKWSTLRAKPAFIMAYLDRLRDEQSPLYPEPWRRDIPALQTRLVDFDRAQGIYEWTPE